MFDSINPLEKCAPEELRVKAERQARCRFVTLRRASGLTQLAWAARAKCDRASVENWERGASRVPAWAVEVAGALRARVAS
jgi:DNA-binding transcriptional regulator YiaG